MRNNEKAIPCVAFVGEIAGGRWLSVQSSIIYNHKFNKEVQQNKTAQLNNLRVIQVSRNYAIKLSWLKTVLQIDFENTIGGKDVSTI